MLNSRQWQEMMPDEAKQLLNNKDVHFVDVREVDEYEEGHIPNITNIPLSQFAERVHELDKDTPLVMVCRSGNRSAQACEYLISQGYSNVKNLVGGMMHWDGEVE
ncbi:rhodanese-like domain-containing protein [Paenibacillus marinisediminis]